MSRHPNHRSSLLTASPPPLSSLLPTDSTRRSIVDACAALKAMVQVPPLPRLSMRRCLHQSRPLKAQKQMFCQHCYYATIITPPTHRTGLDISAGRLSHRHYPRAALCCRVSCPLPQPHSNITPLTPFAYSQNTPTSMCPRALPSAAARTNQCAAPFAPSAVTPSARLPHVFKPFLSFVTAAPRSAPLPSIS